MINDDLTADTTNENIESLLIGEESGNGSLLRLRYLAFSIPIARQIRKTLWGSPEPLFDAGIGAKDLAKALDQVWTWVQDSPEVKRFQTAITLDVDSGGSEYKVKEIRTAVKPIRFPKPVAGELMEESLPSCQRAYELSDAVDRFITKTAGTNGAAWWRPTWTAVFLTTGSFERVALPRWIVTRAGMQAVSGRARGYAYIEVPDVGSVSPAELSDAYIRARQKMTEWGSIPRFELTPGRPEEYASEVLAQLELELILEAADERFAKGESVHPELWPFRPKPKALEQAWKQKAKSLGIENDKVPSKQAINNFQSRVPRATYESVLRYMWLPSDDARAEEEAERSDKAAREAFRRTPKS